MDNASAAAPSEVIFQVDEPAEGGFIAHALGHAIVTEADTLPELREMVLDAVRCHFDAAVTPKVVRLHFVRDEVLAV